METRNKENAISWIATHPGTILRYELEERGICAEDFAEMIGEQKFYFNEIIRGERALTKDIAKRIGEKLGIPANSLINLQKRYEEDTQEIKSKEEVCEQM